MQHMDNNHTHTMWVFLAWLLACAAAHAQDDSISGRVMNDAGDPSAGVWVIAETAELATPYRKIVVSDHSGRFVLPQLPAAGYAIWVRGYGLVDSEKVPARRGADIELRVTSAANAQDAALIYPSNYWLALLRPPPADHFGTPDSPYQDASSWLSQLKLNCVLCHQLGSAITRLPTRSAYEYGLKKASGMHYFADALGFEVLLDTLADWGQRIAAGALPDAPRRPQGIERNIVITQWAWGDQYTYAHDEIATDKRDPRRFPFGPIYGVDLGNDYLLALDPTAHSATRIKVPTRGDFDTPWCEQTHKAIDSDTVTPAGFGSLGCPSAGVDTPHRGRYNNPANPHNPMMDEHGRVWLTTQIRRQWDIDVPQFCRDAPVISAHRHHRQLAYFDPRTEVFTLIDTCFGTHHLQFDDAGVLWLSGDNHVIGWFDTKKYSPQDPDSVARAQGWSEVRIDSDGDGLADRAMPGFHYGIIPNPTDGSVWTAVPPGIGSPPGERGRIHRYDPATDTHEVYMPPAPGVGPRGIDVDANGAIWTALAGSGHVARFDRTKCTQTWGNGEQCPQAWTLWESPGPQFAGLQTFPNDGSTEMHYYLWVDQFDIFGLGANTVIVNGTGSDALLAFRPATEDFIVIRIPYPLNTYTRGLDGRIDDPTAGWKGRGLWFTNGLDPIIHSEIPQSYVGHVQLRPNPLAK